MYLRPARAADKGNARDADASATLPASDTRMRGVASHDPPERARQRPEWADLPAGTASSGV
jgi:hypothetical protein